MQHTQYGKLGKVEQERLQSVRLSVLCIPASQNWGIPAVATLLASL